MAVALAQAVSGILHPETPVAIRRGGPFRLGGFGNCARQQNRIIATNGTSPPR